MSRPTTGASFFISRWILNCLLGAALGGAAAVCGGQTREEPPAAPAAQRGTSDATTDSGSKKEPSASPDADLPIAKSWVRVTKDYPVWIDVKKKEVIVRGKISLQRGPLEMFACPKGTKEHESVVAVEAPSRFVHMALLAVGARPGKPVAFVPEYRPASGTKIEIEMVWRDKNGKIQRTRAQEWVKNAKTGKPLRYDWVFGGSIFYTDEMTGERYYAADGGELVCVSNFANAMLDLPIESTAANQGLLYIANDERIPPRGTPVLMILRPKLEKKNGQKQGSDGAAEAPRKKSTEQEKES